MTPNASAPWHRESFDRFVQEGLPRLLAGRLPLIGYQAELRETACRVRLVLPGTGGDLPVEYEAIPRPDAEGLFHLEDASVVVLPYTREPDLERAEIRCVGEQLLEHIEGGLGEAPGHLRWDEVLARTWLPLDGWVREFLALKGQRIDQTNWLARRTHLRRLLLDSPERTFGPGHWGRVCPFETPEGPNVGRVLSVAMGAVIRQGRLVVEDARPEAALGLTASTCPLLEHNDLNRQLMGANMLRQWFTPPDPEPALVQTGSEPDAPGFWCGRNLLTAFVSWGLDNFEDGVVVSESCARRLGFPQPLEAGDRLSNRHGIKAVVCRILPDGEMPHLEDGTPVEIAWSFTGFISRIGLVGALREAALGRIARARGEAVVVPPFHAPSSGEMRAWLRGAGLPEDGMEQLLLGEGGPPLERRSTAGWVYWGRSEGWSEAGPRLSRDKLRIWTDGEGGQQEDEAAYELLARAGAWENLLELFNTRAAGRPDARALGERLAAGEIGQAGPPSPMFAGVARRLAAGGIRAEREEGQLCLRFASPEGETLRLARPVPHPWLPARELAEIGVSGAPALDAARSRAPFAGEVPPERGAEAWMRLFFVNSRLQKMVEQGHPEVLVDQWEARLREAVEAYFRTLLVPGDLRFGARVLFSGRAVSTPGSRLAADQVGLPEEMAWALFLPRVIRRVGVEAARDRSPRAAAALGTEMARSWVLLSRHGTQGRAPCLAFRPVRTPGSALRVHPLVCGPMDTDFDGDQLAVSLPLTEAAQREAGDRLTLAGWLRRDPTLLETLQGWHAAKWGLARLSLTPEGRREILRLAGEEAIGPDGVATKHSLAAALRVILERDGVDAVLAAIEALMALGFQAAKKSGASPSPFPGTGQELPPAPETDEREAWDAYTDDLADRILSRTAYSDPHLGVELLLLKSGARGNLRQLARILSPWCVDQDGEFVVIRDAYRDGLSPEAVRRVAPGHWNGLLRAHREWRRLEEEWSRERPRSSFGPLARARRSLQPGRVLARAAAAQETDPLTDPEVRLFVGLPPREDGPNGPGEDPALRVR